MWDLQVLFPWHKIFKVDFGVQIEHTMQGIDALVGEFDGDYLKVASHGIAQLRKSLSCHSLKRSD
jgi:hypothetical protein